MKKLFLAFLVPLLLGCFVFAGSKIGSKIPDQITLTYGTGDDTLKQDSVIFDLRDFKDIEGYGILWVYAESDCTGDSDTYDIWFWPGHYVIQGERGGPTISSSQDTIYRANSGGDSNFVANDITITDNTWKGPYVLHQMIGDSVSGFIPDHALIIYIKGDDAGSDDGEVTTIKFDLTMH